MSRVGILFVHGIGEQKRFEHLEGEARQLVHCLQNDPNIKSINIITHTSADAAYHAEQITWRAEEIAPVCVAIEKKNGERLTLELREVWWSDLDDKTTLRSQMAFWLWGLSQWVVDRYEKNQLKISDLEQLRRPGPCWKDRPLKERGLIRLKLFFIAMFFSLVLCTLSIANLVLKRLAKGRIPGPDLIYSYIGDVKLLTQQGREARGALTDMGLPPRVSVRRRVVSSLVDMAMSDYDRWYVLAHSLGSVVALNGLMETDLALPNYLDQEKWQRCLKHKIRDANGEILGPLAGTSEEHSAEGKQMLPPRPQWLSDHHVIFRDRLFARLEGFLTYGSPLDKFSALWPNIVRTNPDPVFGQQFEWINVFDETDPVGGALDDYGSPDLMGPEEKQSASPLNFAFSAYPVLLISHLRYLDFNKNKPGRLVNRVAQWCLDGGQFPQPRVGDKAWQIGQTRSGRSRFRRIQWGVAFAVLAILFGYLLNRIGLVSSESAWGWLFVGVSSAFMMALITGGSKRFGLHKPLLRLVAKLGF